REYLDFLKEKKYEHILANIVSQGVSIDPQEKNAHIVIDKGGNHGIESGLLVVNEQGVAIGKIGRVKPESAELILVTNNEAKLACSIQNSDKTSGVVEGRLGLTMEMNLIPQSEKVSPGNMVVTSGLEKDIPRGLVVGKVIEVDNSKNEVWQQATVEPLVDFDNLTVVSVLVP
ncbi:MAG TPA: rod shape-determining protein MreC, partial [Patescibacteria group bacterium]|nr:rod shape-determining protein MreC [Patescibacteria group bacterium]